jgi:hypothetical protein
MRILKLHLGRLSARSSKYGGANGVTTQLEGMFAIGWML